MYPLTRLHARGSAVLDGVATFSRCRVSAAAALEDKIRRRRTHAERAGLARVFAWVGWYRSHVSSHGKERARI